MDKTDKDELIRLFRQIRTKSAQSASLVGSALMLHANGMTDEANENGKRADKAVNEAEATYQEFLAYLDKL